MKELLYVFVGGGAGSTLRFIISLIWRHMSLHPRFANVVFPWPTFIANIIGCLLIGVFYQYSERWGISPEMRLLLTTGLCGGFTTFSTFSYEGISLIRGGLYSTFFVYSFGSIVIGMCLALLPMLISSNS